MGRPKQLYVTLYLSLLSYTFFHTCTSELCHPQDKKALLELKKGFKNPLVCRTWDPLTDCCVNWGGVHCSGTTNRVTTLEDYFGGTDLAGPIPPSIGDLLYLEVLWWHKSPNLTGPIPRSITRLQRLRYLVINWANLSGPVPHFLGELQSIRGIDFSFNNFTGPVPSSLSKPPNLYQLDLSRNKLTGPIPRYLGASQGSNFALDLSHNMLSGTIPDSFGNFSFDFIDLSRNRLEGDATHVLERNNRVFLSRNSLQFDLSKVQFRKEMYNLDLSHNRIFGSIPEGMVVLKLQVLNLSYNRLCGKIPFGGTLQEFDNTAFFHNRCLCGPPLNVTCKN